MAIALVSGQFVATAYSGGTTSFTITFPSNTSAGDTAIIWIAFDDSGTTVTPPTGFSVIHDMAALGFGTFRLTIMGKLCSAGENGFVASINTTSFNGDYGGAVYSGCVSSGTIWDVVGSENNGFNPTPTALALTTLEANEYAIAFITDSGNGNGTRSSPTSGWNNDVVSARATDMWGTTVASAGSSGDFSATVSNWGWDAIQIALKPDTGGGGGGAVNPSFGMQPNDMALSSGSYLRY